MVCTVLGGKMKTKFVVLIFLILAACSGYRDSTPTATPIPIDVRVVNGDRLPSGLPSFESVDLWQFQQWGDIDALLISREMLYQAKNDVKLQQYLHDIAFQTVIFIYDATTQDAAEILQLKPPTNTTTTMEYILVAVRATESITIGGGVLKEIVNKSKIDILRDITLYTRTVQGEIK
jgi:hypothetical protein